MTGEDYAKVAEDTQAAVVAVIKKVVAPPDPEPPEPPSRKGLVLDRDPVNLDESKWLGSLLAEEDLDEEGDERVHAWVVTFAGSVPDPAVKTVGAIAPEWPFSVQFFYSHDFGTTADNSEKRARSEVLRVQWAIAGELKFEGAVPGGIKSLSRHTGLSMRVRLKRMGGRVIHHGVGELTVKLDPLSTR